MMYRFDGFELDGASFILSGCDGPVPIEPLVFDLIHCFVRHPDTLLSRDALIEKVWKGRIVSDATLSSAVKAARRALGDSGEAQAMIRTVRGRGFQFAAPVECVDPAANAAPVQNAPPAQASSHPSLSVGPFRAIGVTPELGGVVDALAGNLATILTRVPMLQVSVAESGGASAALQLRGDVRKVGGDLHANIQLIDNGDGHLFWGRMFQHPAGEDAASGMLEQIIPRLEPQLVRAIGEKAGAGGATADARTLLIKATGILTLKGWSRRSFEESAKMLRQAIAKEEGLALAHAQLALILSLGARFGLLVDELAAAEAAHHADRALELDDLDPIVTGATGCALSDIGQTRRARPLIKKAIELDPNNAQAWAAMGGLCLIEGDFDEAVRHLEKALSVSPMDPRRSVWGGFLATAHLVCRDLDAAMRVALQAVEDDDRNHMPFLALAAVQLLKGDAAAATNSMRDVRRIRPDLPDSEMARLLGEDMTAKLRALEAA